MESGIMGKYKEMKQQIQTTAQERVKNAEILTPDKIVQKMISEGRKIIDCLNMKKEEFVQKNKRLPAIIEPCCGKGVFLVYLWETLKELGYDKDDIILILDWNDVNIKNVEFCDQLMGTEKGTLGDALKIDYGKYDLVITNPPYNEERGMNRVMHQIYQKFCERFLESKFQLVIIKAGWSLDNGKQFVEFRQKLIPCLQYIEYFNNEQGIFPGCNIWGGVLFYVANSQDKKDQKTIQLKRVDGIQNVQINKNEPIYVLKDIQQKYSGDLMLNKFQYLASGHFLNRSYQDKFQDEVFQDGVECIQSLHRSKLYKFINKNLLTNPPIQKFIVAIPAACGVEGPVRAVVLKPGQIFCQSYIGFICENEQQAEWFVKYILSKYSLDLISSVRITQTISKRLFENHKLPLKDEE